MQPVDFNFIDVSAHLKPIDMGAFGDLQVSSWEPQTIDILVEDHGIYVFGVTGNFDSGGTQMYGGYSLDIWVEKDKKRIVTQQGANLIKAALQFFNLSMDKVNPEILKNRKDISIQTDTQTLETKYYALSTDMRIEAIANESGDIFWIREFFTSTPITTKELRQLNKKLIPYVQSSSATNLEKSLQQKIQERIEILEQKSTLEQNISKPNASKSNLKSSKNTSTKNKI